MFLGEKRQRGICCKGEIKDRRELGLLMAWGFKVVRIISGAP